MIGTRVIPLLLALMICIPSAALGGQLTDPGSHKTQQVEREFALFAANWIEKINKNYASRPDNIQVIPNGVQFVGHYSSLEKDSLLWSIKQVSQTPVSYIGLLEYMEWMYECAALTHEEALQGPFVPVKGRKVTEIFRYSQNRWLE